MYAGSRTCARTPSDLDRRLQNHLETLLDVTGEGAASEETGDW